MTLRIEIAAIHVHLHNGDEDATQLILSGIAHLGERIGVIMSALSELKAKVDLLESRLELISGGLDNIAQDIADIKAGLPAEGGLTAQEVTDLSAQLDAVVAKAGETAAKAEQLDNQNPAAPVDPPV